MHQRSPSSNFEINVDGSSLDSVDTFCYLGSMLAKNFDLNNKIAKCSKAPISFGLLRK